MWCMLATLTHTHNTNTIMKVIMITDIVGGTGSHTGNIQSGVMTIVALGMLVMVVLRNGAIGIGRVVGSMKPCIVINVTKSNFY